MKNKNLGYKLDLAATKLEERRLSLQSARMALELAIKEGKEEDIENAREAVRQSSELYDLEHDILNVETRKTDQQKILNTLKDTELAFQHRLKELKKEEAKLGNLMKNDIRNAITFEDERYNQLKENLLKTTQMYLAAEKKKQAAAALTKYIEKFGAPGQWWRR